MGCSIFAIDSSDDFHQNDVPVSPNPNPYRWELLDKKQYNHAYVLKVRYPDCTNFEGIKVLVYKGIFNKREKLDPHFQEGCISPIARFRPDEEGWKFACEFAKKIKEP